MKLYRITPAYDHITRNGEAAPENETFFAAAETASEALDIAMDHPNGIPLPDFKRGWLVVVIPGTVLLPEDE